MLIYSAILFKMNFKATTPKQLFCVLRKNFCLCRLLRDFASFWYFSVNIFVLNSFLNKFGYQIYILNSKTLFFISISWFANNFKLRVSIHHELYWFDYFRDFLSFLTFTAVRSISDKKVWWIENVLRYIGSNRLAHQPWRHRNIAIMTYVFSSRW